MDKLKNPFKGNWFRITQTQHSFDSAIDATGSTFDIVAPCDVLVHPQKIDSTKFKNPYFEVFNNDFMIRFVHAKVTVKPGIYREGTVIGTYRVADDAYPDHLHIALRIAKVGWVNFMEYLDRSVELRLGNGFGKDTKYKNWSHWGDKQLNIIKLIPETPIDNSNEKILQLQSEIKTIQANKEKEIAELTAMNSLKIEDLKKEITKLEIENKHLTENVVKLPDSNGSVKIFTDLVVKEAKSRGIKGRWHEFIDRNIQSSFVRGFLKYNWFYVAFIIIAFGSNWFNSIQESIQDPFIISIIGSIIGLGSYGMQFLLTHYDKNKDGLINKEDLDLSFIESQIDTKRED